VLEDIHEEQPDVRAKQSQINCLTMT
jgi:hypothetical protein